MFALLRKLDFCQHLSYSDSYIVFVYGCSMLRLLLQVADTYAVCAACSRLSCDLRTCDKCGSSLSDDSTAHCYSSDPKRLHAEPSAVHCSASVVACPVSASDSLPCGTSAISVGNIDSAVRPQALYVNVNNQAFPVIGVGSAPAVSGTLALSHPLFVSSASTAVGQYGTVVASQAGGSLGNRLVPSNSRPISTVTASATAVNVQRTETVASVPQYNLPSYNLQPPPPPFAASVARLPGIVSGSLQAAVVPTPSAAQLGSVAQSVQVNAVQIRIGAKKFKPSSAVTFKDDGILFTLKGL